MKKESKNNDVYADKALDILPHSEVQSRNAIALVNEDLKMLGFQELPVITLTGEPSTGKTTLARYWIIEKLEPENYMEQDPGSLRNC